MRDQFRGYYTPDEEALRAIWGSGLIILDTNALLNLFRYTESTRDAFLLVLQSLVDQLWIPHQVGLEFQRRRLDVIADQTKAHDDLIKAIDAGKNGVEKALQGLRLHPSLNRSSISDTLTASMEAVSSVVEESRANYEQRVVDGSENDRLFEVISDLYEGRVGVPFENERLQEIYIEGAARYDSKVPPGFKDKDKPEPDRYGDLILWRQILSHVSGDPRPAIFVTDDGKEDWWRLREGKTHGPRIELVDEYFEATGSRVHFYSPERFLDLAKKMLQIEVSQTSLFEVQELSRERTQVDINSLFAERANLQDIRLRAERELASVSSRDAALSKTWKLDSLKKREYELNQQIDQLHQEMDGVSSGHSNPSIVGWLRSLEAERDQVEQQFLYEYSRFEELEYSSRSPASDATRGLALEAQIRRAVEQIEQIDRLIDSQL